MREKEFYNQKGTYNRVPLSKKIKAENLIPIDIFEKFNSKGSYFLEWIWLRQRVQQESLMIMYKSRNHCRMLNISDL